MQQTLLKSHVWTVIASQNTSNLLKKKPEKLWVAVNPAQTHTQRVDCSGLIRAISFLFFSLFFFCWGGDKAHWQVGTVVTAQFQWIRTLLIFPSNRVGFWIMQSSADISFPPNCAGDEYAYRIPNPYPTVHQSKGTTSAEQLRRAMLPLPLPYKKPCHC